MFKEDKTVLQIFGTENCRLKTTYICKKLSLAEVIMGKESTP